MGILGRLCPQCCDRSGACTAWGRHGLCNVTAHRFSWVRPTYGAAPECLSDAMLLHASGAWHPNS